MHLQSIFTSDKRKDRKNCLKTLKVFPDYYAFAFKVIFRHVTEFLLVFTLFEILKNYSANTSLIITKLLIE